MYLYCRDGNVSIEGATNTANVVAADITAGQVSGYPFSM